MPDTTHTDTRPAIDQALLDALKSLEDSLNSRDMWNLPPQIFLWQPPVMAGIAVDPRTWQQVDGHPSEILGMIAGQWDDVKAGLIAQDPIVFGQPPQAVVLISEAWSLNIGKAIERGDLGKVAEYERAAANRTIYQHPDRQEIRNLAAVDAHHHIVTMVRYRGEDVLVTIDGIEGGIPDAMKDFMTRVTARRPVGSRHYGRT